jgi:hypothetical protein
MMIHYVVHKKLVVIPFWSSNETLSYRMCTSAFEILPHLCFAYYMLLFKGRWSCCL